MRIAFFVLVLLIGPSIALSRGVPRLTYAQLMEESDLVVIVHSLGTRDATKDDKIIPFEDEGDLYTPIFTKFSILAVLKGQHEGETLELCHYKSKPKARSITGLSEAVLNGPSLVWFTTRSDEKIRQFDRSWMTQVSNDFVLFLKSDDQERLTFVTGQFDALASVRQIHDPLPQSVSPNPR